MEEWFNDEEVNDLLTTLMDRLCSLERMGGDTLDSMLVLIPNDKKYPILFAHGGKPWSPWDTMTYQDVELGVKVALKARLARPEE